MIISAIIFPRWLENSNEIRIRNIMAQRQEVIRLIQELIRIDSQNPPGSERKISLFIKDYLKKIKVKASLYEYKKNRTNVVCRIESIKSRKTLLVTPHTDTVPATGKWLYPPLSGKINKGRIYGRGATDCKGNVAVALSVIKKIRQGNIRFNNLDLIFAFTADEESGSEFGIKPLLKDLKGIDYGVVLDSDEFEIIVAQKGLFHLRVELFGKEAHGAFPQRGINAIEKGVFALSEILKTKLSPKTHPLLERPTINIGKFEGGDKVNIVAGYAYFDIDIRLIPSMKRKDIIRKIERVVRKHIDKYKITVLAAQDPIEIDRDNLLIKTLQHTLRKNNIRPKLKACFGATVINFLTDRGIGAFAFGFGSRGTAHTKNEYVKANNLSKGCNVLLDYLISLDKHFDHFE
ncbi:MAG: ArgE/DapE family deacylase [Candidatus Omnitrophota bacterium]